MTLSSIQFPTLPQGLMARSLDRQRFARFLCHGALVFFACLVVVLISAGHSAGQAPLSGTWLPIAGGGDSEKNSMVGIRTAYMWGWHEIWLRDGDNPNIRPSKKEITLNSVALGVYGERFFTTDFAARIQAWGNSPTNTRNDFLSDSDGIERAWDTRPRYVSADLSLIWYLGLGGAPYRAGLVAGYRYNDFNYNSSRYAAPAGTYRDHLQVHVPYLGLQYAHVRFAGTVVTLDLAWSALALSKYDATRQYVQGTVTHIDGHSLTGLWFDCLLGWYVPVTSRAAVGLFARYAYLELSGGATVANGVASTRFSMDSRHHLFFTGAVVTYAF